MSIWVKEPSLEQLQRVCAETMVEHLGIEFTEVGPDYLCATMPVDARTIQPARSLHGGASVALAETLGSVGAVLCVDYPKQQIVGLAVNASHVRAVKEGAKVRGRACPLHLGKKTQLWEIRVDDEQGRLVCMTRLTLAVLDG